MRTWGILTEREAHEHLDANHVVIVALQDALEKAGRDHNIRAYKATAKRLRKLRKENYRVALRALKLYWHDK
jgi:ribosomal protein L18E